MLTVQANTIVDDKQTLVKAQAEILRLKALLSKALKQLEIGGENGEGEVGFTKLIAENDKLKEENKSLKSSLKKLQKQLLQPDARPDVTRAYSLGALREDEEAESSGEEALALRGRSGQQQHPNAKSRRSSAGNGHKHRRQIAESQSSGEIAVNRSGESLGNPRTTKATSSSLHSLVSFSYFEQPFHKAATHQSGAPSLLTLFRLSSELFCTGSERDEAPTLSKKKGFKKSLSFADNAADSIETLQPLTKESLLRQEEHIQLQLHRQMVEQEQAMMARDPHNTNRVSKVQNKLQR